jgi:hypothetical protein
MPDSTSISRNNFKSGFGDVGIRGGSGVGSRGTTGADVKYMETFRQLYGKAVSQHLESIERVGTDGLLKIEGFASTMWFPSKVKALFM